MVCSAISESLPVLNAEVPFARRTMKKGKPLPQLRRSWFANFQRILNSLLPVSDDGPIGRRTS
jgi:hypothetical protein